MVLEPQDNASTGRETQGGHAIQLRGYAAAVLSIALVAVVAKALQSFLSLPNLSIVFLVPVLLSAVLWGPGPSIAAAILSVLVYDFFFVQPLYHFIITSPQDVLALLIFLVVAVITSNLTVRIKDQAEAARKRESRTAALYALSQQVAGAAGLDEVLQAVVQQVSNIAGGRAVVLAPAGQELVLQASHPPGATLSDEQQTAATWAWQHNRQAGRGTEAMPWLDWLYLPLTTAHTTVGVLGVRPYAREAAGATDQRLLLEALAYQAAVAVERANLVRDMGQARLLAETERLRSALLSSISHDLRTPLASIIGAVTSLLSYGAGYDETAQRDLQLTIREEAERLNRFVGNLLDVTRLETGALHLNRQWVEVGDIVGAALAKLKPWLDDHEIDVKIENGLPLLALDFVLMEQVLFNLLDNAVKYSASGTSIAVRACAERNAVTLEIADEGIGIPPGEREHVFDKFYRVQRSDYRSAGTGLGLFISRGFIEAHGGRIEAKANPAGRGSLFAVTLPVTPTPAMEIEGEAAND